MGDEGMSLGMESTEIALSQEIASLRRQLAEMTELKDSGWISATTLAEELADLQARYDALRDAAGSMLNYHDTPGHGNSALPHHWTALRAALVDQQSRQNNDKMD